MIGLGWSPFLAVSHFRSIFSWTLANSLQHSHGFNITKFSNVSTRILSKPAFLPTSFGPPGQRTYISHTLKQYFDIIFSTLQMRQFNRVFLSYKVKYIENQGPLSISKWGQKRKTKRNSPSRKVFSKLNGEPGRRKEEA